MQNYYSASDDEDEDVRNGGDHGPGQQSTDLSNDE